MQGDKNWILPKEINKTFSSEDSHWLKSGKNHFCPFIVPNGGSVATMDSAASVNLENLFHLEIVPFENS
jgi:pantothenate kinase